MQHTTVLILLGSLREASVNKRLALAAIEAAPAGTDAILYPTLADLPHYNQDLDNDEARPAAVNAFYAAVRASDAVLAVTPEYNGTTSSVLKNAIDWGSRPSRRGPLAGKPVAVIGATFGRHGGVWAQEETRRAFTVAGAIVVERVVVAVGNAQERFAVVPPSADEELIAALGDVFSGLHEAASTSTSHR